MKKVVDITGKNFNNLLVIKQAYIENRHVYWLCKCDCGKECIVQGNRIKSGHTKSCGCRKQNIFDNGGPNKTHGSSKSRLYRIWAGMIRRCCNPNSEKFKKDYQDRGITICPEWRDFSVFSKWAINNGYRNDLTIDRKDNDKGYYSENCRWATAKQQGNNKQNNINITYKGQTHTLAQWVEILGTIKYGTLYNRIVNGWSIEDAFNIPVEMAA
jgi:hypothetical protein